MLCYEGGVTKLERQASAAPKARLGDGVLLEDGLIQSMIGTSGG